MPSYEEQLAMYRQQLRAASAPIAPAGAAGPTMGQTASLAFNTMMQDLGNLANMVHSTPSTPYVSDIQTASNYYQPTMGSAMMASSGVSAPGMSVYAGDYQSAATNYAATRIGDATTTGTMGFASVGGAAVTGIGMDMAFRGLFSAGKTYGRFASGAKAGATILGGAGAAIAGITIGGTAGMGVGAILGGGASAALPLLPGAAAFYAGEEFVSGMFEHAGARSGMRDYLQQSSWRYMGGQGFNKGDRSSISKGLAGMAVDDRDLGYGDIQGILQSGTELGMFNATKDADDFKRKFKELKDGLKSITKTMKVS